MLEGTFNKLQKPQQAPPTFTATPSSILQDTKSFLDGLRAANDRIIRNVTPASACFDNVILPLAHSDNALVCYRRLNDIYDLLSPIEDVQNASREVDGMIQAFTIETALRDDLFDLIEVVVQKDEQLDTESQNLLQAFYRDHIRKGLRIPPGHQRSRFMAIQDRINKAVVEFKKNTEESNKTSGTWFTPADLDGMPANALSTLEKGEGENEGKVFLRRRGMAVHYAKNAETRRRAEVDLYNRFNANVPIFKEITVLRDEAARLLGYSSHAEFRIEEKMAESSESVNELLKGILLRLGDRKSVV